MHARQSPSPGSSLSQPVSFYPLTHFLHPRKAAHAHVRRSTTAKHCAASAQVMSSAGESELATTLEGIVREEQCDAFTGDIDCPHCVSFSIPSAVLLRRARPLAHDLSPPSPADPLRLPIHHMRLQRPSHIG
jgi:hypothetical protein